MHINALNRMHIMGFNKHGLVCLPERLSRLSLLQNESKMYRLFLFLPLMCMQRLFT